MPASFTWLLESVVVDPVSDPQIVVGAGSTGDLALTWSDGLGAADLSVVNNDLAREDGLKTAVLLSLFLDRRAEDGDALPDGDTDQRGWWADAVPEIDGDKIGSRLWLLGRAKARADVLPRVEEYVRESLAWLVDDDVAARVDVVASLPVSGALLVAIDIYRPQQKEPTRFRFSGAWSAEVP